jgi:hypothetical protein
MAVALLPAMDAFISRARLRTANHARSQKLAPMLIRSFCAYPPRSLRNNG